MRRCLLLLPLLLANCQAAPSDSAPHWRRPGPAVLGPLEREVLPDDGFLDSLAARGGARPLPDAAQPLG
jgi:hypothetical protein